MTYLRLLLSLASGTNANIIGGTYGNTNDGISTPNNGNASNDVSNIKDDIGENMSNKDMIYIYSTNSILENMHKKVRVSLKRLI